MPAIYLFVNGQQLGPHSPAQMRQLLVDGQITPETAAWYEGLAEWSTVHVVLANFPAETTVTVPPTAQRVELPTAARQAEAPAKKMSGCVLSSIIAGVGCVVAIPILAIVAGIFLGPIVAGIKKAQEVEAVQTARTIELAMFAYATDNNGAYPTGKTSTEVFQKLIDGKYIPDGGIFYLAMPGKTKATSNTLTTENVCFDVTSGVTSSSSDDVPTVFMTGFIVTYTAGAVATEDPGAQAPLEAMPVAYKSNAAMLKKIDPDGTVPDFIPASFNPGSETYQQLRP